MNEEPGWLRSDAAARTRKTEQDREAPETTRKAVRPPASSGVEAEASRALAAGQPERLRPGAVLHLQRAAGNAGVAQLLGEERDADSPVKEVVGHGAGMPLETATRQRMEASFGEGFSDVRVHTGGSAASSARAVNAHAYTVGNEIVLGEGQAPGSPTHERTLAHELTHIVQQRSGPVDGSPTAGGISLSDPTDRFERAAESTADAVVGTGRAPDAGTTGAGASIQREELPEEEEEEEVQELAIQRLGRDDEIDVAPTGEVGEPDESASENTNRTAAEAAPSAQSGPGSALEEPMEEVQELAIQRIQREEEEERLLL